MEKLILFSLLVFSKKCLWKNLFKHTFWYVCFSCERTL